MVTVIRPFFAARQRDKMRFCSSIQLLSRTRSWIVIQRPFQSPFYISLADPFYCWAAGVQGGDDLFVLPILVCSEQKPALVSFFEQTIRPPRSVSATLRVRLLLRSQCTFLAGIAESPFPNPAMPYLSIFIDMTEY
jgi:hypothetical protein